MSWQDLEEIGLSEKEARVLQSLFSLKEAKASEVSKASGVSRVRVYDVLKDLYSKGLVRKKKGRPVKYVSLPPEETLERFLDWKKEGFEEEKERILKKKKQLKEDFEGDERERPKHILEFISLGEVSEKETRRVVENSEKKVKIISETLSWLDSIERAMEEADSELMVLFQDPETIDEEARRVQEKAVNALEELGAEIRFTGETPLRGCISEKEAVINLEEKESSNLLRDCVYTNHESFVRALNIYFDNLWEESG